MLSNKEYYKPVLEDEEMFVETKDKFDAAASSTSPQELEDSSDTNDTEKDESSGSHAETEGEVVFPLTTAVPSATSMQALITEVPFSPVSLSTQSAPKR